MITPTAKCTCDHPHSVECGTASDATSLNSATADDTLWPDSYIMGECDNCGEHTRLIHTADPDAWDILEDVGPAWWCRKCYIRHPKPNESSTPANG